MGDSGIVLPAEHPAGDCCGAMLELVLDSTEAGSGVDDFLTGLAGLAARELSRPHQPVSCGITVNRPKEPPSDVGSTGGGSLSVLRIPLNDGGGNAVLNLYSPRAGAFEGEDRAEAHRFAAGASLALRLALRTCRLRDSRQHLAAAMQSRTIIDLAIGSIMAQNRCGRDAAFKILRNTSNNRNLKIHDVAASVVASIAGDTDFTARFEE